MSLEPAAACLCLDTSCQLDTAPLTWPSLASRIIPPFVEHIILIHGILMLKLCPLCTAALIVQLAPQVLDLLPQVIHRLATPHRLCKRQAECACGHGNTSAGATNHCLVPVPLSLQQDLQARPRGPLAAWCVSDTRLPSLQQSEQGGKQVVASCHRPTASTPALHQCEGKTLLVQDVQRLLPGLCDCITAGRQALRKEHRHHLLHWQGALRQQQVYSVNKTARSPCHPFCAAHDLCQPLAERGDAVQDIVEGSVAAGVADLPGHPTCPAAAQSLPGRPPAGFPAPAEEGLLCRRPHISHAYAHRSISKISL